MNKAIICILLSLALVLVADRFFKSRRIDALEAEIRNFKPDTVEMEIIIHHTKYETTADTVTKWMESKEGTTFVHKILKDWLETPLFDLFTEVNSKEETFKYEFNYRPFRVLLMIKDSYDIRKGLEVRLDPSIGDVRVDLSGYEPIGLPRKYGFEIGGGYVRSSGIEGHVGVYYEKLSTGLSLWPKHVGYYLNWRF